MQWLQSSPTFENALWLAFDAANNLKVPALPHTCMVCTHNDASYKKSVSHPTSHFSKICMVLRMLHNDTMKVSIACVVVYSNA